MLFCHKSFQPHFNRIPTASTANFNCGLLSDGFAPPNGCKDTQHPFGEEEKEKITQAVKTTPPTLIRERKRFGIEDHKAPPPRKGKEKLMGIRRVACLA